MSLTSSVIYSSLRALQISDEEEEDTEVCCVSYGISLYVLGAFCMAFGVNLQKYSINKYLEIKESKSEDCTKIPSWKQPLWITGLIIYCSSGGLLSAALAFAEQSLLAPLMSVMIISNALLARFLLGEKIVQRDVSAMLILLCGVLLSTIFAPTSGGGLKTTEGLIELYKKPGFIVYVVLLITLLTILFLGNRVILAKIDPDAPSHAKFLLKISPLRPQGRVNLKQTIGTSVRKLNVVRRTEVVASDASIETYKVDNLSEKFFSFSFGAQAGIWGGLCVTMMKSAISIIVEEVGEAGIVGVFTSPLMYCLLAVLICCWTMQLYWISAGLERYPGVFVVSIEAALNELIAVCGGILYFQEYQYFTPIKVAGFSIGIIAGLIGLFAIATRNNYDAEDGSNDDPDVFQALCGCSLKAKETRANEKRAQPIDPSSRESFRMRQSKTLRRQQLARMNSFD